MRCLRGLRFGRLSVRGDFIDRRIMKLNGLAPAGICRSDLRAPAKTAVGDDDHLAMTSGLDRFEGRSATLRQGAARFAAGNDEVGRLLPPVLRRLGPFPFDLVPYQSLEFAGVDFLQPIVGANRQAQGGSQRLGRLHCSAERTGVDGVDVERPERGDQGRGLSQAQRRQSHVRLSLDSPFGVRQALPVADEIEKHDEIRIAAVRALNGPCRRHCQRTCAASVV